MMRVAILDSGLLPGEAVAVCNFTASDAPHDHGRRVAALVRAAAPDAALIDARLFGDHLVTTPELVAEALLWARHEGAEIVNLSLGLAQDRPFLAAAIARLLADGVVIVAPAPARGAAVYPAAYPGVIAVTGDARCGPGEFSALDEMGIDFGACPRPLEGPPTLGGASFAAARVTGALARLGGADAVARLRAACRFRGRERR